MYRKKNIYKVLVAQLCPALCDPMDCSLPDSSVHGIFQTRILEWVAISFSRGSSQPRDWTWVSCIAGRLFTIWATRETWTMINAAKYLCLISFSVPLFLLWTSNRFSFFTFGDQMQRNLLVTPYILAVLSGSVQLCLFHSNIECLQKFWFKWEKSSNDHPIFSIVFISRTFLS